MSIPVNYLVSLDEPASLKNMLPKKIPYRIQHRLWIFYPFYIFPTLLKKIAFKLLTNRKLRLQIFFCSNPLINSLRSLSQKERFNFLNSSQFYTTSHLHANQTVYNVFMTKLHDIPFYLTEPSNTLNLILQWHENNYQHIIFQ